VKRIINLGHGLNHVLCEHSDCVVCLRLRYERLIHAFDRASSRAARRYGTGVLWLDAIDLRTRLGRAKLNAWFDYESALYSSRIR